MPMIRSIQVLSDRAIVTTANGTKTFLYSQVPQNIINQGAAAVETMANDWLNDPANDIAVASDGTRRYFMAVHVVTLSPLTLGTYISNVPIVGNWWEIP